MRMRKTRAIVAVAAGLVLASGNMAMADDKLVYDGDLLDANFSGGGQGSEPMALGDVCPGTTLAATTKQGPFKLGVRNTGSQAKEHNAFQNNATLTYSAVEISPPSSTKGALSVSIPTPTATTPIDWETQANGVKGAVVDGSVTLTVPSTATTGTGSGSIKFQVSGNGYDNHGAVVTIRRDDTMPVSWNVLSSTHASCTSTPPPPPPPPAPDADGDGVPDASDNCVNDANADQADADGDALGNACDSNSYAPAVAIEPLNADGNEGTPGNPQTSGAFTDQDGNSSLTITKVSGAGTVTDNGNGTFSWSHTTRDDASGTVIVKASDGEHTDATQEFSWTAANVAPVITAVTPTPLAPCEVSLATSFSDQGLADTHDVVIGWGDTDTTDAVGNELSGYSATHKYTSAGTYNGSVTVTDDDLGSDTKTLTGFFKANNSPSVILQPINSSGTRSGFKIGSTIPVKITVTGCDDGAVSNLAPAVNLEKEDTTADVSVNEAVVTETPTNGKLMRWDSTGQQYIYNLSTKQSQFTGAQLTAGTWTVSVNDSSFARPVKAAFDLRK